MPFTEEQRKERARARAKQWALDNPEKVKYSNRRWAAMDKTKARRRRERWELRNREAVRIARNEYKRAHPEKFAAAQAKRRLVVKQQCPIWADVEKIKAVYAEAARLTAQTGIQHHVDHEIPLRGVLVSGLHVETNLRAIPAVDNMRKHNKFEAAYAT